jgi:ABC-type amino acid transport substrate-binding protein
MDFRVAPVIREALQREIMNKLRQAFLSLISDRAVASEKSHSWRHLPWLLIFGGMAPFVQAQPSLRVLAVNVEPYTLPKNSVRRGLHVEIVEELARLTHMQMEVKPVVYVRLAMELQARRGDMAMLADSPELDQHCQRVGVVHDFYSIVLSRADNPIGSMEKLEGKKLGVIRNAYYDYRINNNPKIILYDISNTLQGARMMAFNRIDAVISSNFAITYAVKQSGFSANHFSTPFVVNVQRWVLCAGNDLPPALVARFRQSLEKMHQTGAVDKIIQSYK